MDTLTHALSGMLVARASYRTSDKLPILVRSWVGFFIGAFPDIDFISRFFGITAYLNVHRGITHSVLLIPLWAVLLSWVLAKLSRNKYSWKLFLPVCLLSLSIHIFADVITAYGTEVLSPFSDFRLSIPTTFIIDLYFTGIILFAILISTFWREYARRIALTGVFCLMGYILLQSYWMRIAIGEAYASVPVSKMQNAKVTAIPQPLSPFNWKLIIETDDRYYLRYINLYRDKRKIATAEDGLLKRIDALYLPTSQNDWIVLPKLGQTPFRSLAAEIWNNDKMRTVRRFMDYPSVHRVDEFPEMRCVWFADQRFVLQGIRAPFIFGACQHRESGKMKFLRLVDDKPKKFD